jgi:uncharacterized damage-inducible protein DinB
MRKAAASATMAWISHRRAAMPSPFFAMLADYNAWANHRLYEACEKLTGTEYMRDRAPFGSLHAILNRILATDRIWIARIEGREQSGLKLDQILYGDLTGLKVARIAEDERIRIAIAATPEGRLDHPLVYRSLRGDRVELPLRVVLGHLFNNQTHYRAQAHALLAQAETAPPSLELIEFARRDGTTQTADRNG